MRTTTRDIKLVGDLSLSLLLSRDQIIELGYFGSVTRLNARMRKLIEIGLVRRLETPFFNQSLYTAGPVAQEIVSYKISKLLESRTGSPRFVRHALACANCRIALCKKGGEWRFEQQLWRKFHHHKDFETRPDGMLITGSIPIFLEIDMGHVAPSKFREKLIAYDALAKSRKCQELYGFESFRLLTITTGPLRSRHLRALLPSNCGFEFLCQTFEEVGARPVPYWS